MSTDNSRVTELEILITHMQEDFRQLNSVVLAQQAQIDELEKTIVRLTEKVEKIGEEPESRDPVQERPPHY